MKLDEIMSASKRERVMRTIDKRRKTMRDAVRSVAQHYSSAAFFYGPGGLGKTHLITEELDALCGNSWVHHTGMATPKGLLIQLMEKSEAIHLFEDCEAMYKAEGSSSILRGACGSPGTRERFVTHETAHEKHRFAFTGGIIIVSNENLSRKKGPMAAVASRFRPIKWDLTIEERVALILDIADQGWAKNGRELDPKECRVVAKFLIEEMTGGEIAAAVDLRTFTEHALPAYAQWQYDNPEMDWKQLIRAKLSGEVKRAETRDSKNERLASMALVIDADSSKKTPDKVKLWNERTGLGQAQYFRHLRAAKASVTCINPANLVGPNFGE